MRFFVMVLVLASVSLVARAEVFVPLPSKVPFPKENPPTKAKIELGKQLYFDTRLSHDGTISCNSCHNLMSSGEDNRPNSVGVGGKKGGRTSPTVWNSAFMGAMFWDGRAASLEEQAKGPMTNPIEMAMMTHDVVIDRLKQSPEYVKSFKAVFGGENPVTLDNAVKAIAAFERTLVTPNSPVDKFLKGNKNAISESAKRGMKLVQEMGCISCHIGPNYAGPGGVALYMKFPTFPGSEYDSKYNLTKDLGRYEATKQDGDKNLWRVPTWRNVALTAPYFHNGSVATLDEAVRVMLKTQLNKTATDEQIGDIVAFLEGLTGEFPKMELPRLPPAPKSGYGYN